MRTLKFKGWPTNAFFAAVYRMFGGSSQITTAAENCFVVWTVHNDLITARSAVVRGWEEPPNIWLTVAKNAFGGWALNYAVRVLFKGAVTSLRTTRSRSIKRNPPGKSLGNELGYKGLIISANDGIDRPIVHVTRVSLAMTPILHHTWIAAII